MKHKALFELRYIDEHFEFSPKITPELEEYLLDHYLIDKDRDTDLIFVTAEGEMLMGSTKEELKEKYDEQDIETYEDDEAMYSESEGTYDDEQI
jgi:hypothetical protein